MVQIETKRPNILSMVLVQRMVTPTYSGAANDPLTPKTRQGIPALSKTLGIRRKKKQGQVLTKLSSEITR
jgi:hypothetical protein